MTAGTGIERRQWAALTVAAEATAVAEVAVVAAVAVAAAAVAG